MVLREQALDPHTPYLLLVQQAALSPQSGDKQKKHCGHILKQYIFKTLGQHCANVFSVYRRIYFPSGTSCHCYKLRQSRRELALFKALS